MEVNPLQRKIVASDIAPEQLAGNPRLTQEQKVAEASRQFEAVLLRQILGESQKTVIPSEFSDNSTAAGIYQDLVTSTLADNISKSGAFGLAKTFEQQLNRPTSADPKTGHSTVLASLSTLHGKVTTVRPEILAGHGSKSMPLHHHTGSFSVKHP